MTRRKVNSSRKQNENQDKPVRKFQRTLETFSQVKGGTCNPAILRCAESGRSKKTSSSAHII